MGFVDKFLIAQERTLKDKTFNITFGIFAVVLFTSVCGFFLWTITQQSHEATKQRTDCTPTQLYVMEDHMLPKRVFNCTGVDMIKYIGTEHIVK